MITKLLFLSFAYNILFCCYFSLSLFLLFWNKCGPINHKTVSVENEVESDNAPENNVGGVFWFYSCEGGFDAHKIPEDVLEKMIGTGTWDDGLLKVKVVK